MHKLLICFAGLMLSANLAAAMYRWTDENGVTVYSSTPPPTGQVEEIRKHAGPTAEQQQQARDRLQGISGETENKEGDPAQQEFDAEQKRLQKLVRQQNCEAARKNLQTLQNMRPSKLIKVDGKYERLDEQTLADHRARTQEQIDKNCGKD